MVVESKLCACKVLIPILLIGVDVVAEVGADVAVCVFRLSVGLRVIGCTEVEMCTEGFEENGPEVRCETRVTIRDERQRHAVEAKDVVPEDGGELNRGDGHLCWDDVDVLGQAVNEDSDGVVSPSCFGECGHEVHRD